MKIGWLEVVVASIFIVVVLTLIFSRGSNWLEPRFWRNAAIFSGVIMTIFLIFLTFDTHRYINMGGINVPEPDVINHKISYVFSPEKGYYVPKIGEEETFFGKTWSKEEAYALINKGKMTIQSRNCMDCHTLLGNGAYYAPDLTKAWLDPKWEQLIMPVVNKPTKEEAMAEWLKNPDKFPTWTRKMPNLRLTDEEAKAVVAYLKYMSAIYTNGFPDHFGVAAKQ